MNASRNEKTAIENPQIGESGKLQGVAENANLQTNDDAEAEISFEEIFAFAKKSKGIDVTAEYLDMSQLKEGINYIFILIGMTTFRNSENMNVPAVTLMDENKKRYIVASKVIVSACERIQDECPVAIGVIVKGKKQSSQGQGKYYDVSVVRY